MHDEVHDEIKYLSMPKTHQDMNHPFILCIHVLCTTYLLKSLRSCLSYQIDWHDIEVLTSDYPLFYIKWPYGPMASWHKSSDTANFVSVYCYNCSIFLLLVNPLLCLIYKLYHRYACIGKNKVHIGFGTVQFLASTGVLEHMLQTRGRLLCITAILVITPVGMTHYLTHD